MHVNRINPLLAALALPFAGHRPERRPRALPPRPHHQLQPHARERARRVGGAAWDLFKDADRARRGLPMAG